ncbi:MAG TPA: PIG-L family deacetylase [Actinomycetota bacterium]|jgi:LmbE family N-acetylglucosaminyl deacetylase
MKVDPENTRGLAAVVAHPDDDAYGISSIVALHGRDPRFRFVLVHATDGEAGSIAEGSGATPETLGAVRREEDCRAWITLGRVPDRHEWFGYPDGGLAEVDFEELKARIAAILTEERPDVVITFGPDGITGHPDHIVISRATTEAFHEVAGDGGPGLRRLVYGVIRRSVIERWNEKRVADGLKPWDPRTVYHLRGVPDEDIDIEIDTSSVAPLVRAAMREHRTQWGDMNPVGVAEEELLKNVSRETEIIAWPPRESRVVLADIFEDL